MKKTILIIAAILFTSITGVFAQKHSIKTAPLDLFTGRLGITYEGSVANRLSVLVTYKKIDASDNGVRTADFVFPLLSALGGRTKSQTFGYLTEFSLRKYAPGKGGMSGVYLQPSLAFGKTTTISQFQSGIFGFFSDDNPPTTTKKDLNSAGFRIGYQWMTKGGFTFDLGLGGSKYFNLTERDKGSILFNCKLGYAF